MTNPLPTEQQIAEIAGKLTKAQREIVLRGSDRPQPAFMLRDDHDGRKASGDILKTRLFVGKMGGAQVKLWTLTAVGLAVRNHLTAMGEKA